MHTQAQFKSLLAVLLPLKEAYQQVMAGGNCANVKEQVAAVDGSKADVNKFVVSSLLNALEESMQVSQVPEFLKVIDSIEADKESDCD